MQNSVLPAARAVMDCVPGRAAPAVANDAGTDLAFQARLDAAHARQTAEQTAEQTAHDKGASTTDTLDALADITGMEGVDDEDAPSSVVEDVLQTSTSAADTTMVAASMVLTNAPAAQSEVSDAVATHLSGLFGAGDTSPVGEPRGDAMGDWLDTLSQSRRLAAGLPVAETVAEAMVDRATTGTNADQLNIFDAEATTHQMASATSLVATIGSSNIAQSSRQLDGQQVPLALEGASQNALRDAASRESSEQDVDAQSRSTTPPTLAFAPRGGLSWRAAAEPGGVIACNDPVDATLPTPFKPMHDALSTVVASEAAPLTVGLDASTGSTAITDAGLITQRTSSTSAGLQAASPSDGMPHPGNLNIFDDAALPHELHHHLRWMHTQGRGVAELRLNPEELGPVHVTITTDEQRVEANFVCAHPVTRDLLEAAMPRLRDAMEAAGMELAGGFVATGEFGAGHSDSDEHSAALSPRFLSDAEQMATVEAASARAAVRHDRVIDTFA